MSSSSAAAAKKKRSKPQPVRVLIKCSWSGARHPVPSPLPSSGDAVTTSTRLSDVVGSIRPSLPGAVFEGESTVVYLRKSAGRSEWGTTKLKDLGVGEEDGGGGGGGGGVLLTLNLPGGNGGGGGATAVASSASKAPAAKVSAAATSSSAPEAPPAPPTAAAALTASSPAAAPPAAATAAADPQPMDVDPSPGALTTPCQSPSEAVDLLLSSNFDADSRETVLTLLKIVDNVLSKPGDAKVRTIRLANPAIQKKIVARKGAVDFLLCVGFTAKEPAIPLLSGSIGGIGGGQKEEGAVEFIELTEENEDPAKLLEARKALAGKAVHALGLDASELPKLRTPPPLTTAASHSAGASTSNRPGGEFNPYKTHSYNTQSAAHGAPDPHSVTPGSDGRYVSKTEKELDALKAKQARLERKMQKLEDRGLVATRPGQVGNIVALPSGDDFGSSGSGGGGGGKGDGALLAARMKKMEEERKKREEGGFTTKAMRDLEKMKKARVYSHATVRVSFPDGCALTAKFLPTERVRDVRGAVSEAMLEDLRAGLQFDLYVAPPRRLLEDGKTLDEEGLVPAAKVFVSWKVGGGPPGGWEAGAYVRPELFAEAPPAAEEAFPDAKKLVDDGSGKQGGGGAAKGGGGNGNGGGDPKASREEELMKRMLGGSKGLLGKLGGGGGKSGKGDGGKKPKWFKG